MTTKPVLSAVHLGRIAYPDGVRLQESLVRARAAGRTGDWLLFADHPPVLTVGRGAQPGGLKAEPATLARRGVEVFQSARGGDITWHGPGQLVGYPIVHLDTQGRDLHRFLRALEQALIDVLAGFGVAGERVAGRTGVWVGGAKIASIGIAVRSWVAYHGFALNVNPDLSFFDLIHPCGLRGIEMTSLAARLGTAAPDMDAVREAVAEATADRLGLALRRAEVTEAHEAAASGTDAVMVGTGTGRTT